jgi:hypothetical protein
MLWRCRIISCTEARLGHHVLVEVAAILREVKVRNAACPCCAPLEAGHFLLDQFARRTGLRGLFRAQVPRALRPRARRGFWLAPWNARL